ncbi:hypothetical protein KEM52_000986, partial [Ascosphaera acerosa]
QPLAVLSPSARNARTSTTTKTLISDTPPRRISSLGLGLTKRASYADLNICTTIAGAAAPVAERCTKSFARAARGLGDEYDDYDDYDDDDARKENREACARVDVAALSMAVEVDADAVPSEAWPRAPRLSDAASGDGGVSGGGVERDGGARQHEDQKDSAELQQESDSGAHDDQQQVQSMQQPARRSSHPSRPSSTTLGVGTAVALLPDLNLGAGLDADMNFDIDIDADAAADADAGAGAADNDGDGGENGDEDGVGAAPAVGAGGVRESSPFQEIPLNTAHRGGLASARAAAGGTGKASAGVAGDPSPPSSPFIDHDEDADEGGRAGEHEGPQRQQQRQRQDPGRHGMDTIPELVSSDFDYSGHSPVQAAAGAADASREVNHISYAEYDDDDDDDDEKHDGVQHELARTGAGVVEEEVLPELTHRARSTTPSGEARGPETVGHAVPSPSHPRSHPHEDLHEGNTTSLSDFSALALPEAETAVADPDQPRTNAVDEPKGRKKRSLSPSRTPKKKHRPSRSLSRSPQMAAVSSARALHSVTPQPRTGSNSRENQELAGFPTPPSPPPAVSQDELAEIQAAYEARIAALEKIIAAHEAQVARASRAAEEAKAEAAAAADAAAAEAQRREAAEQEAAASQRRVALMEGEVLKARDEVAGERKRREITARALEAEEQKMKELHARLAEVEERLQAQASGRHPRGEEEESTSTAGMVPEADVEKRIQASRVSLAKELHQLYKEKHMTKVAALKKSYEHRWEKRVMEAEGKIKQLQEENDRLRGQAGRTSEDVSAVGKTEAEAEAEAEVDTTHPASSAASSASGTWTAPASMPDLSQQQQALQGRVDDLEHALAALQHDYDELMATLEAERVEKGELVAVVDEWLALQAEVNCDAQNPPGGTTRSSPEGKRPRPCDEEGEEEDTRPPEVMDGHAAGADSRGVTPTPTPTATAIATPSDGAAGQHSGLRRSKRRKSSPIAERGPALVPAATSSSNVGTPTARRTTNVNQARRSAVGDGPAVRSRPAAAAAAGTTRSPAVARRTRVVGAAPSLPHIGASRLARPRPAAATAGAASTATQSRSHGTTVGSPTAPPSRTSRFGGPAPAPAPAPASASASAHVAPPSSSTADDARPRSSASTAASASASSRPSRLGMHAAAKAGAVAAGHGQSQGRVVSYGGADRCADR